MPGLLNETDYEEYIVSYLTLNLSKDGDYEYTQVDHTKYDKDWCLIPDELIAFLKDSQPKMYSRLVNSKGSESAARKAICDRVDKVMTQHLGVLPKKKTGSDVIAPAGTLHLLRNQLDLSGCHFDLAYFKPVSNKTPEHAELYRKNCLSIVRQLQYSCKNNNEIDLCIFLNGLPIITIELKNTLTGQKHHEAIKQYMMDRQVKGEKFLEFKRCLVHFAIGTEEAYMTTKLDGQNTRFFPYNKEYKNKGVKPHDSGYRTGYIWEDLLRKDSLMELIESFIGVQVTIEKKYNEETGNVEDEPKEALIFPRYHQRRAVKALLNKVREQGVGHNYLIQHSAGSGKSNTITWLAYRLSNFYQNYDDEKSLFDCTIVVTNRRVLNVQLQSNLKQFERQPQEIVYIGDKGLKSDETSSQSLRRVIQEGKNVIVTTIQKFKEISDTIKRFPDRTYAVIIDEAHSSQSGENARQMRRALSLREASIFDEDIEEENDEEDKLNDIIEEEMRRGGRKRNISFFAFTATPKGKTIELFCEREYGTKEPFDTYTMEQAIKEEFILDVMEHYMSFERYYYLVQNVKMPDKEYERKKAMRLLGSYADIQDRAIERKTRIMLEHFVSQTEKEIGGKARAMLVTRSRLHAVRYKKKFDSIMQEMKLPYRALVAFSGSVREDDDKDYTESMMNNLPKGTSIPDAFKLPKYRILIVANKYQTGFDEPLLHTMFVDKKLGGTSSVQTLSRLNRKTGGKDSTMVLDFVNDPEEIRKDFQKYYGKNKMDESDETDPDTLYDIQDKLYSFNVFTLTDVQEFAKYYFSTSKDTAYRSQMNVVLDRISDVVKEKLDNDTQKELRKTCGRYYKLFGFLSQIISFTDTELMSLYPFAYALQKKIECEKEKLPYEVLNEARLQDYRVKFLKEQKLELKGKDTKMKGQSPNGGEGGGHEEPEMEYLSKIIAQLNEQYGLNLDDDDKADLESMRDRIMSNEELLGFFNKKNSRDDIRDKFDGVIDDELLDFINSKLDLYNKLTEDRVNNLFKDIWFNEIYDNIVNKV